MVLAGWTAALGATSAYERSVRAKWSQFEARWDRYRAKGHIPYKGCFLSAARQYRLPLILVLAIAKGESDFNPRAVSSSGAVGIMQILWPKTAAHLGFDDRNDLFKPCTNILAGTRYFAELMDRYRDDVFTALAAYNYGPTAIDAGAVIPKKAVWYADYIHTHLMGLANRPHFPAQKGLLRRFTSFQKAGAFAEYLGKTVPGVFLDIQLGSPLTYDVYLGYGNVAEKDRWLKKILQKTGVAPESRVY